MISGANRGIGLAIAENLLNENYRFSLGVRNPDQLQEVLASAPESQTLCQFYDARDRESAMTWIDATAAKFGGIDVLVNNAGILYTARLEDDAEDLLVICGKSCLIRLVFPHLRKSGSGRIIDIISMSGKRVKGNWVGYSMSKYAAMASSQTARLQGWDDGIRVTVICPGFVKTDMTTEMNFPREKMTRPEDISQIVSTLLLLPNEAAVPEVMMNCVFENL